MMGDRINLDCGDDEDCQKAESLVNEYIDGLLSETEMNFISRHLSDCAGCKHGFDFEYSLHTRIQSLSPICMPIDVKSQILLALGFPGMSIPNQIDDQMNEISSQMGIPKGDIPRGSIPRSGLIDKEDEAKD